FMGERGEFYLIQIVLILVNSRIPSTANSRPKPEDFIPPKGRRGSDETKVFTQQVPASIRCAIFSPRATSRVKTAAPNPNGESLAILIASSSSLASIKANTGPKISSS